MTASDLLLEHDEYLTYDIVMEIEQCSRKTAYDKIKLCNEYLKKKGFAIHPKNGRTPAKVYSHYHGYNYNYVIGKYKKIKGTSAN